MGTLSANKTVSRMTLSPDVFVPPELRPFESSKRRRTFPVCTDIVRRLRQADPDLEIDERLGEELECQVETADEARAAWRDWTPRYDPRLMAHQHGGVGWLLRRERGVLAHSQGTGKTVTALVALEEIGGSAIIVCSNTKRQDWVDHVREWTSYEPILVEAADDPPDPESTQVYVMGYAAAKRHSAEIRARTLIVDEAHALRNRKIDAFKEIRRLARKAQRLYLLTATPIVNGPDDLWSLLHLVDPQRFSGYWDFVSRFMTVEHGYFGVKVGMLKADEEQAFWSLVSEYMVEQSKDESILPRLHRRVIDFDLWPEQRELYQAILKEDAATYDGVEVETVEMVAKITRLRQIALDPALVWPSYDGRGKLDALIPTIEGPTVVFSLFAGMAERLAERLGSEARVIHGGVPDERRREILTDFSLGRFNVLAVTHGTGGEGLNLVAAERAVLLDLHWHPAGNAQARDRIYRIGQTRSDVWVDYLRARRTIEDHVLAILRAKQPVTVEALAQRLHS